MRYNTNITLSIDWFEDLNLTEKYAIQYWHTGYPYYFSSWALNPEYEEWEQVEWIAHKPKGMNSSLKLDWDDIYHIPITHDSWPNKKYHEGKLMDRGEITHKQKKYKLYTAHFPQGYLYPPPGNPKVIKSPMIVPDLQLPAKVVLFPRVRKIKLQMDLQVFKPPNTYCSNKLNYELQYSNPIKIGRKPLQLMLLGAVLVGALLGGIMGGGVSAAMLEPIKAEFYHIQQLNRKTSEALSAISNSIDALNVLTQQMRAEQEILKKDWQYKEKVLKTMIDTNHNQIMCMQYTRVLDRVKTELDTLFTSGLGRRTSEFQTLINPTEDSSCEEGICTIHVMQIFLDNAFAAYHTKPIPQLWDTKLDPLQTLTSKWITPIDHFLWIKYE